MRFAYAHGATVLDIPALDVARGDRVFLRGPSGSGKTTLLGLLAGVLTPSSGSLRVLDTDLSALSGAARDRFRAAHVGYVFQMFNLIPYLSVRGNITLPLNLSKQRAARLPARGATLGGDAGIRSRELADREAQRLAATLEIDGLLDAPVHTLSVGQQQRVAVARALIGSPELVVCDEPTSALDADRRDRFLELLFASSAASGCTLVFVSHDRSLAARFTTQLSLPALNRAAQTAPRGS